MAGLLELLRKAKGRKPPASNPFPPGANPAQQSAGLVNEADLSLPSPLSQGLAQPVAPRPKPKDDDGGGGPCDCSYQRDCIGRKCGGRAAVRRTGGRHPSCGGREALDALADFNSPDFPDRLADYVGSLATGIGEAVAFPFRQVGAAANEFGDGAALEQAIYEAVTATGLGGGLFDALSSLPGNQGYNPNPLDRNREERDRLWRALNPGLISGGFRP